ncbi:hypothetical protein [Xanthomonas euroxanthea]|uniref:hypothetical protein n=1 Tax=Xanthomonas euroxanthea TaxID=2259622 RepID=UPI00161EA4E3|nr:hypothetical protein [Xanthomonas euroxanthea]MBB5766200.1 flagellar biosynthesis protein FliQ [Xanthomonas euroxanthea]
MNQLLRDLYDFGKSIVSTFLITVFLSVVIFGAMPFAGSSSSELEKIATESIAFRTIQILLPLQVLVSGLVLMVLAFPQLSTKHAWFDRWLIRPLAQYAAGLSAVALAVVLGLTIVVALEDRTYLTLLLWPMILLLMIIAMSLSVPWMSEPAALEATTVRRRLGWGLFFLLAAAVLLHYSYNPPAETENCNRPHSVAKNSFKPNTLRVSA